MSESSKSQEPYFDLPEEESTEELDAQVQKAQEQLLQLKRQQELIEKQKSELEELGRRQEALEQGRNEMIQNFSRSLVVLEREAYECEKRLEQLNNTRENFRSHLRSLEAINPRGWHNNELQDELSKALHLVDEARTDFTRSRVRINADAEEEILDDAADEEEALGYSDRDFLFWLKAGFAFTLPVVLALVLILLFLVIRPL